MDWKNLFFSADGRIGRQEFWIGFILLWVASWVLGLIPFINLIAPFVLIWCNVCVNSKRLHDMGKTGWLQLIPIITGFVLGGVAVAVGGMALVTAAMNGQLEDPAAVPGLVASLGGAFAAIGVACLVSLIFLLWLGLTPSQVGENQFGAPKGEAAPAIA